MLFFFFSGGELSIAEDPKTVTGSQLRKPLSTVDIPSTKAGLTLAGEALMIFGSGLGFTLLNLNLELERTWCQGREGKPK